MSKSNCGTFKVDNNSLYWVKGCLTVTKDSPAFKAKTPCKHVFYDPEVFKLVDGVLTDKNVMQITNKLKVCAQLSLDAFVFSKNEKNQFVFTPIKDLEREETEDEEEKQTDVEVTTEIQNGNNTIILTAVNGKFKSNDISNFTVTEQEGNVGLSTNPESVTLNEDNIQAILTFNSPASEDGNIKIIVASSAFAIDSVVTEVTGVSKTN